MPNDRFCSGRLVPASSIEFSRAAKNLAWLVEIPLHVARDVLSYCYGFGSTHELQSVLEQVTGKDHATGPFDPPRSRPPYYRSVTPANYDAPNRLTPLTNHEQTLLRAVWSVLAQAKVYDGRIRRRAYSVIDAAFFSPPSVHRKQFAAVKLGILAMEGGAPERERYLECHWPPAFWSYLEADFQLSFDARPGLDELKSSSLSFAPDEILSIAEVFQASAAHRAPAVFLAMVGEDPEPLVDTMPDFDPDYFDDDELPTIGNDRAGLFELYDDEEWYLTLQHYVSEEEHGELLDRLCEMHPEDIAANPPPGTPAQLVVVARKWRLYQLRALCRLHGQSEYRSRYLAMSNQLYLPDSPGPDVDTSDPIVLVIQPGRPSLMVYAEFEEVDRVTNAHLSRQVWRFKVLLTRTTATEPEDVVGYMAGWLVAPCGNDYVCDADELLSDAWQYDDMLGQGLQAFIKSFLPYDGSTDLLSFVNGRWHNSVAITEVVLRKKYRKRGLLPLALSGFHGLLRAAPFTDFPDAWLEAADFSIDETGDLEREPEIDINPPAVFMIPTPRRQKVLRRYLMGQTVPGDILDDNELEVFPYSVDTEAAQDDE